MIHASITPTSDEVYQPTSSLLTFEDDPTRIPVIDFAKYGLARLNLGCLTAEDAAAYLDQLAGTASELAAEVRAYIVTADVEGDE